MAGPSGSGTCTAGSWWYETKNQIMEHVESIPLGTVVTGPIRLCNGDLDGTRKALEAEVNMCNADGKLTQTVESLPAGGFVTAPFHTRAGNHSHAKRAIARGQKTTVEAACIAAAVAAAPAGGVAVLAGAAGGAAGGGLGTLIQRKAEEDYTEADVAAVGKEATDADISDNMVRGAVKGALAGAMKRGRDGDANPKPPKSARYDSYDPARYDTPHFTEQPPARIQSGGPALRIRHFTVQCTRWRADLGNEFAMGPQAFRHAFG